MTEAESRVVTAWREAARDLGIRFTSPFVLTVQDGERVEYLGLVHGFGRRVGTLISVIGEPSSSVQHPDGDDYYRSQLASSYGVYRRQHFIDMLDDWKYYGPGSERPDWYSGKTWGEN